MRIDRHSFAIISAFLLLLTAANRLRSASPELTLTQFGKAGIGGDDTAVLLKALQAASKTGKPLRIPKATRAYRIGPVDVPGGVHLTLDPGTVIDALPTLRQYQRLINIVDVSNVSIVGPGSTFRMDHNVYRSGEYRHCVFIAGSAHITLDGVSCVDAGGDGFYISGSPNKLYSEDVRLLNVTATGSRRQGLSIISAKSLRVSRSHFDNSRGAAPECGIDMEPERSSDHLDNIVIEDTTTTNNSGDGVRIALSKLTHRSAPISIAIFRHRDLSSGASGLMCSKEHDDADNVHGILLVDHFETRKAHKYGVLFSFWNSSGASALLRDLLVVDANESHSTDDNTAVAIIRGGGGKGRIGNIEFTRVSIRDDRAQPKLNYYFSIEDYSHIGIEKVSFHHPGVLTGAIRKDHLGIYQGQGVGVLLPGDTSQSAKLWSNTEHSKQSAMKP